jgi:hypothetical protein
VGGLGGGQGGRRRATRGGPSRWPEAHGGGWLPVGGGGRELAGEVL